MHNTNTDFSAILIYYKSETRVKYLTDCGAGPIALNT